MNNVKFKPPVDGFMLFPRRQRTITCAVCGAVRETDNPRTKYCVQCAVVKKKAAQKRSWDARKKQ